MIYVTKSYLPDKKKLLRYIDQIYDSHRLTNGGPLVEQLEENLKTYLGVKNIILVANGTLALQVLYKALNIKGSAITTPFSFPATTSSLVWESIKPIFADINLSTWNIDPLEIENSIQQDTTAIVATHIFGNPCDVETIGKIAKKNHLKIIYDAAHCFGVKYKEKSILNWGDASILSFHATKLFHTIEGGAIITNDDALAKKIRLMINFGISGEEEIIELGINAKMNEFQAAMGLCVLDEIENIHLQRKKIWEYYASSLKGRYVFQKRNEFTTNNYAYFPILFENEYLMNTARRELNNTRIFPRRYFYPTLDTLPYLSPSPPQPNARNITKRILCLPIYPGLPYNAVDKICKNIANNAILTKLIC